MTQSEKQKGEVKGSGKYKKRKELKSRLIRKDPDAGKD